MSDITEMIKQNRMFILGAGFSAAAGIPMMDEPLMGEMEPFLVLPGAGKAYEVRKR